jgi:nicotinate phosphoribosyltransferase
MIPTSHLATENDLPLFQLSHTFMQSAIWLAEGMADRVATYDLFVRDMPKDRNYMVFGGLEELLTWLPKLRFKPDDVDFLVQNKIIPESFAKYLLNFKFTGDVYAMPEGTVFFPYEPIVRVTAPIIEASLIEIFLMNLVSSNTGFLSKAARIKMAAREKFTVGTGPLRAHSFEAGLKASRAAFLCGISSQANAVVAKKYGMKLKNFIVNAQHLFITSFPDELSAFEAMVKHNPDNSSFMIDTYNFKQGLQNAITVGLKLKAQKKSLAYVTIDSGDMVARAKYTRAELDKAGLNEIKILLAGNIDEHKIETLAAAGTPADLVATVTEYNTLSDSPKLEAVYKLAELRDKDKITYTAKLAPGKVSYPGRKQVYRSYKDSKLASDLIVLEDEHTEGAPLLQHVIAGGKLQYHLPQLEEIQKYIDQELNKLPDNLLDLDHQAKPPVAPSKKILDLLEQVKKTQHFDDSQI